MCLDGCMHEYGREGRGVGLGWVEDEVGSKREVESFEMDEMRRREVRRGLRTHESRDEKQGQKNIECATRLRE